MMKKIFLAAVLLLTLAATAWAAGTCIFSITAFPYADPETKELQWACTSDSSGNISAPTITGDNSSIPRFGFIRSIQVSPGTSRVPTDNYNVYVYGNPSTTRDMLGGLGVDSDNVTIKTDMPLTVDNGAPYYLFNEVLTPAADSMGNATTCTIKMWIGR